jgi:hypothetical protein
MTRMQNDENKSERRKRLAAERELNKLQEHLKTAKEYWAMVSNEMQEFVDRAKELT